MRLALLASPAPAAEAGAERLRAMHDFVPLTEAEAVVVVGGDGFMLQVLHQMLEDRRALPAYGMNRGTIGFLMNGWVEGALEARIAAARAFTVNPLAMTACGNDGRVVRLPAINEVSLLRETRQTAKIAIHVNGRLAMAEMICDGVLVATPAGSTAYNLSASGPILPLDSHMLALTPISPFRPRRWKGAILPDRTTVRFEILESGKRPVSAVADQREVREVAWVEVALDRSRALTLLFDPEHALDERIVAEQFMA